jgi:AcrR family transcriptional regulator
MRRTKEEAAATRARLLDAALAVFHARGYAATTLEDIAREAGITRGAIQWHFGNKADLYNAIIREGYAEAAQAFMGLYEAGETPLQKLRLMLIKWLSYAEENIKFRTMLELMIIKTEITSELSSGIQEKIEGNRATVSFFADLIRQGIEAGEIRPETKPEIAALAALGLVNGMVSMWLIDTTAFTLRGTAEETVDLFLRGLAAQ